MTGFVLASGSATRREMLQAAGLAFTVDRPDVDEAAVKRDSRSQGLDAGATALALALAKAREVASRHPGYIVIGADQMLECEGVWFDKPVDRAAAAAQLAVLAGRAHNLISAVVAVRDGEEIWRTVDTADLTVRSLSKAEIERYLDRAGPAALGSVGGYQVEGLGIQLFSAIRGHHFTILGMPLLPLLAFLRAEGLIAE